MWVLREGMFLNIFPQWSQVFSASFFSCQINFFIIWFCSLCLITFTPLNMPFNIFLVLYVWSTVITNPREIVAVIASVFFSWEAFVTFCTDIILLICFGFFLVSIICIFIIWVLIISICGSLRFFPSILCIITEDFFFILAGMSRRICGCGRVSI